MAGDGAVSKDSAWSSLREEYVEYAFLGELCRAFWRRDLPVDILRSHTDHSGFDLVMETSKSRHVQLKSSFVGSRTAVQKINRELEKKAGGCVVWIRFDRETLEVRDYLWYGAADPTATMPSPGERPVRHTKGNRDGVKSVRPGQRKLNRGQFRPVNTIKELSTLLFPSQPPAPQGSPSR